MHVSECHLLHAYRKDIKLGKKIEEVNNKIKDMCSQHGYNIISNNNINETCLNNSELHLNPKGTALLAVGFIKFLRGRQSSAYLQQQHNYSKNFQIEDTLHQIGDILISVMKQTR